jgi:hypothetical protein
MILGVTASRTWKDRQVISGAFDEAERLFLRPWNKKSVIVINGGAWGGDELCRIEADSRGWHTAVIKPLWGFYGKPAGHVRDAAMVSLGKGAASRWLAFINQCFLLECEDRKPHGTHGAAKTAERAEEAGIEVKRYGWNQG